MVSDDLAAYLASAGLGLTLGTNLFSVAFPPKSPDQAVCIVEWGADRAEQTFGASLSAVAVERPALKVIVRDGKESAAAAKTLAYAVYKKLRRLGPVTLSSVNYLNVEAEVPAALGQDENERHRYHFDLRVHKDEA